MEEIELFYNILDIIIAKIDNNLVNLAKISTNYQYINLIKKI